jgi:hypothetical protein
VQRNGREKAAVVLSHGRFWFVVAWCGIFAATGPALSADLGPHQQLAEPAPPNAWQFSFTPYGWVININGNATARDHTVDVNDSFFQSSRRATPYSPG